MNAKERLLWFEDFQALCRLKEVVLLFNRYNSDRVKHGKTLDVGFVNISPVSAPDKYTNQPLLGWSELEKLTGEIQVSVYDLSDMGQKIAAYPYHWNNIRY